MGILLRQSVKSSIATYMGVVIGYVNIIWLFPKFLSQDQFGLTRVLISVAVIFSQVALIGTPYSLVRFFPYFNNREQKHFGFPALMLRIALIGFAGVSLIFLLFKNEIEQLYIEKSPLFSSHYLFIFPIAFFMTVAELTFNYCRSLMKLPIPIFFKEVMLRIFQAAAILIFILHVVDFEGFLVLFVASYVLQMMLMFGYVYFLKQFFIFSRSHLEGKVSFRQILRFSLFSFAASTVAVYTANIDTVLLGMLAGLSAVAVYSIAFFIATIIQIPARSMNIIASSIVAEAWRDNDQKKIQRLYSQTSLNQLLIGGFLLLLVWANVKLILGFLPETYNEVSWVIFIVGIGKLFDMATGINGEIINVSKHVKVSLITNLFLIVLTTVANYLLIPIYGVYGAAIATALSVFTYNIIRMIFLYYTYRLQPFNLNTAKAIVLLMVCFTVYYLLPSTKNVWLDGVYQTAVLTAIFGTSILVFKISPEINEAYKSIRSLIFFGKKNSS